MFSLLDRLEGWQLLLVLAPLVLTMTFVRKREESAQSIKWADMNRLHKGWVFINLLGPGLGAKVLSMLDSDERDSLIEVGGELRGSAKPVVLPVLELFFKTAGLKSLPSKDVEELTRWLNVHFEDEPKKLLAFYRKAYLKA